MKKKIERIEQMEKELAELKAEFEKNNQHPEKWQDKLVQPKKDSFYFFITSDLRKGLQVTHKCGGDWLTHRKPEHAFAFAEQAELVKEKMLLMQEMYAFAHVRNEGWKPDWEDGTQIKWGLYVHKNEIVVEWYWSANYYVFGIAVKSEEIAKEMAEIFGERIEKYYNKQY